MPFNRVDLIILQLAVIQKCVNYYGYLGNPSGTAKQQISYVSDTVINKATKSRKVPFVPN